MKILVLNSGSSSQKICLYELGENLPDSPPGCLWEAKIEWEGNLATLAIKRSDVIVHQRRLKVSSPRASASNIYSPICGVGMREFSHHLPISTV